MEHLHFAGYSHSDHVEIYVHPDRRVEVSCWNDGYPNPMGAGGYAMDMPKSLIENYNQEKFIRWLEANFWCGVTIDICKPVEEAIVKAFLENALKKTTSEKVSDKSQSTNCEEACAQEKETPSPHKNSNFWAKLCAKLKKRP